MAHPPSSVRTLPSSHSRYPLISLFSVNAVQSRTRASKKISTTSPLSRGLLSLGADIFRNRLFTASVQFIWTCTSLMHGSSSRDWTNQNTSLAWMSMLTTSVLPVTVSTVTVEATMYENSACTDL